MTVHLCLLDIALGMEYLHSDLNILHGGRYCWGTGTGAST